MSRVSSLQDPFLNALRTGNQRGGDRRPIPVSVYLVNGIKLQGNIEAFDQYSIVLNNNGINQMVFKHAISTIVPARRVSLHFKANNMHHNNDSQNSDSTSHHSEDEDDFSNEDDNDTYTSSESDKNLDSLEENFAEYDDEDKPLQEIDEKSDYHNSNKP